MTCRHLNVMSPTIYKQEKKHKKHKLQLQGQPMAVDLNFIVNDMSSFKRYVTYNLQARKKTQKTQTTTTRTTNGS